MLLAPKHVTNVLYSCSFSRKLEDEMKALMKFYYEFPTRYNSQNKFPDRFLLFFTLPDRFKIEVKPAH